LLIPFISPLPGPMLTRAFRSLRLRLPPVPLPLPCATAIAGSGRCYARLAASSDIRRSLKERRRPPARRRGAVPAATFLWGYFNPSKKYVTGTSRASASLYSAPALKRLIVRSYFWNCWNVTPSASATVSCDKPISSRRKRMREATWRSITLGRRSDTISAPLSILMSLPQPDRVHPATGKATQVVQHRHAVYEKAPADMSDRG
jgi:hypothetical protein